MGAIQSQITFEPDQRNPIVCESTEQSASIYHVVTMQIYTTQQSLLLLKAASLSNSNFALDHSYFHINKTKELHG